MKLTKKCSNTKNKKTKPSTTNSGVYEYDSSVFGSASDAASTSAIYYYRGILIVTLLKAVMELIAKTLVHVVI